MFYRFAQCLNIWVENIKQQNMILVFFFFTWRNRNYSSRCWFCQLPTKKNFPQMFCLLKNYSAILLSIQWYILHGHTVSGKFQIDMWNVILSHAQLSKHSKLAQKIRRNRWAKWEMRAQISCKMVILGEREKLCNKFHPRKDTKNTSTIHA